MRDVLAAVAYHQGNCQSRSPVLSPSWPDSIYYTHPVDMWIFTSIDSSCLLYVVRFLSEVHASLASPGWWSWRSVWLGLYKGQPLLSFTFWNIKILLQLGSRCWAWFPDQWVCMHQGMQPVALVFLILLQSHLSAHRRYKIEHHRHFQQNAKRCARPEPGIRHWVETLGVWMRRKFSLFSCVSYWPALWFLTSYKVSYLE